MFNNYFYSVFTDEDCSDLNSLITPDSDKYLGVMLQSNLSWSSQCKFVSAKASKLLNYLRRVHSLGCYKSRVHKCLVRPCLEYACTVWNPHTASNKFTLETVQRRVARWAAGSRWSSATNQWSKNQPMIV